MTASSDAASRFGERQQSPLQRAQHLLHQYPYISPLVLLIVTAVAFTIANPKFSQPFQVGTLVQQTAITAALGVGQTLVILTAGIDLSVGAITILSSMIIASLAKDGGMPGLLAICIGVALATLAGLLNGLLVTRLNLPPFIVTLGTLSIFTAIALLYSGGSAITSDALPGIVNFLGEGIGPRGGFRITWGVIAVALMYVVIGFMLSQTAWGLHVYAVGDDPESARLSGVASKRVLMSVYTVTGFLCGIGAWVLIGRSSGADPNSLATANLDSITAVVIGGTSLFGGRGRLIGTLIGALIVQSFTFGLSLMSVNPQWRLLAIGILVIVAVSIDQWIRKVKA